MESNYDKAKTKVEAKFAELDTDSLAKKWNLDTDEKYIYISIFLCDYRIEKATGRVEAKYQEKYKELIKERKELLSWKEGTYDETFTIFDLLTFSEDKPFPKGEYCRLNSLHGISKFSAPMDGKMCNELLELTKGSKGKLKKLCEAVGGTPHGKGDYSALLVLFQDLKVQITLWEADEEFPAQMYLMWDENMLKYIKFETIWYLAAMVLTQLETIYIQGIQNGNS